MRRRDARAGSGGTGLDWMSGSCPGCCTPISATIVAESSGGAGQGAKTPASVNTLALTLILLSIEINFYFNKF